MVPCAPPPPLLIYYYHVGHWGGGRSSGASRSLARWPLPGVQSVRAQRGIRRAKKTGQQGCERKRENACGQT